MRGTLIRAVQRYTHRGLSGSYVPFPPLPPCGVTNSFTSDSSSSTGPLGVWEELPTDDEDDGWSGHPIDHRKSGPTPDRRLLAEWHDPDATKQRRHE